MQTCILLREGFDLLETRTTSMQPVVVGGVDDSHMGVASFSCTCCIDIFVERKSQRWAWKGYCAIAGV